VPQAGWSGFALRLLVALLVLGTVLWFGAGTDAAWLAMGGAQRALQLSLVVTGGILAYFATLWVLGFRVRDFRRRSA
jgi:putative peptidoglycan lipid II flippase